MVVVLMVVMVVMVRWALITIPEPVTEIDATEIDLNNASQPV